MAAAVSAAFLVRDAVATSGEAAWVPGPHYLVIWLTAVLVGGAALVTLMVDSCRVLWQRLRPIGKVDRQVSAGRLDPAVLSAATTKSEIPV
jgi:hypothetical protein